MPVLIALVFSILFVAYEFSSINIDLEEPYAEASADMDAGHGYSGDAADAGSGLQALTADSVLKISWLSISFIGQAFCGGLFSRSNPRAAFNTADNLPGIGSVRSQRLTSAIISKSINKLVFRQILSHRIARLKAG
ncbi:MAG: hypothetical protein ACYC5K_00050 [Saccharofermentanales bacterium]